MPSLIESNAVEFIPAAQAVDKGLMPDPGLPLSRPCPFCGKTLARLACKIPNFATVLSRDYERCTCDRADDAARLFEEEYQAQEQAKRDKEAAERMQRRIERAFAQSEMPERWKRYTLNTFSKEGLSKASRATAIRAEKYAHWLETAFKSHNLTYSPNGLYIHGPCGTGKTHLAAAILNYIIENCPTTPTLAASMQELTARLKATYNEDGEGDEESIVKTYTDTPLLLIDDLGSEQPTEWMCDRIFRIVNGRYNRNLPTIVTSNYDLAGLAKRLTPKRYGENGNYIDGTKITDRLAEMCVLCPLDGESRRGNRRNNA